MLNGRSIAALLLLASACGTSPETTQLREAVAASNGGDGAAVAFRFAARRGAAVQLYRLPALDAVSSQFEGLAAERVVGFAADEDIVFVLSPAGQLLALDLGARRARTADSAVALAALGPTGAVLLAHEDGTLATLDARRLTPLGRLPKRARLTGLWGTTGGRAIVAVADSEGPALFTAGGTLGDRRPAPAGPTAIAPWGDIAAVVTDSGVVVTDLLRDTGSRRLRAHGTPLAVAFSASGHRLFVATDAPAIDVYDRFALERIDAVDLPAQVSALRADPFGRYLLGRADSGVLVMAQGGGPMRVVSGSWTDDLPTAGPDGTLLVARGADAVALAPESDAVRGRVPGGARDHWLVATWDPRRPALPLAARPAQGPAPVATGGQLYVQVSSTSNAEWAEGLARDLRLAGMQASVLPPTVQDEMYRVVIGPYATRDQAEAIGRKLGMPYWIFTRDSTAAP